MTTIKDVLLSIIGTYTPDVTNGVEGLAQVDWVWISSAILFIVLIHSIFKSAADIIKDLFGGW